MRTTPTLRALSFRRVTMASVVDIVWAKREVRGLRQMPRRDMLRRRLAVSVPPLLAGLELIATCTQHVKESNGG